MIVGLFEALVEGFLLTKDLGVFFEFFLKSRPQQVLIRGRSNG